MKGVKVERGSTFTFTHDFPYFASFYLLIYNLHVDAYAHENKVTVEIDLLANKL